ncbi:MAG: hypothetical protein JNL08_00190 [Planctomycetes bacterium]|nr:hypothetical protein [Planctomycetota bacterium]
MQPTRSFARLGHLAAERWHGHRRQLERPAYAVPALAAYAASALLLSLQAWPVSLFFAPAFVVGCRYHELSRFRRVRPSRWTVLLLGTAAAGGALWVGTHPTGGGETPLLLALTLLSIGLAVHLYRAQHQFAAQQARTELLAVVDDDEPIWACGGALALLPVLFLLALANGLAAAGGPTMLLWGLATLPLLWLQLRRHRWFPTATMVWLGLGFAIELNATLTSADDLVDDALVACSGVALLNGWLIWYLRTAPRVRSTFAEVAAARPGSVPAAARPTSRTAAAPARQLATHR